jgi:hypothetical protein
MLAIVHLLGTYVANLFKSRRRLEVENLFLRHQLNIALRRRLFNLSLPRGTSRVLSESMSDESDMRRPGDSNIRFYRDDSFRCTQYP